MESLRSLPAGTLSWEVVERGEPRRRLCSATSEVAELTWSVGFAAEGASAVTADGAWAFDRRGMLDKQVVIQPLSGIAARYASGGWLGGGELETEIGSRFTFGPVSLLSTRWAFTDADGRRWVSFLVERRRLFRTIDVVRIDPSSVGANELPLLVTLGSWLATLGRRDQASGSGSV